MADESAVIESPVVDDAAEDEVVVEGSSDGTEDGEQNQESEDDGSPLTGKKLYTSVKDTLANLDPKTAKALKSAIFEAEKSSKKLAELGDTEGSKAILSAIAALGEEGEEPAQIIAHTQQEIKGWREFEGKVAEANPAVVNDLTIAYPEQFQQMFPQMVANFRELNPEAYASIVAEPIMAYFDSQKVNLCWDIIDTYFPALQAAEFQGKEQMLGALNRIFQTHQNLSRISQSPRQVKKWAPREEQSTKTNPALREAELTMKEWNLDAQQESKNILNKEYTRVAGGKPLTEAEKNAFHAAVADEINVRLSAKQDYIKAMSGYLKAGNKKEYLRRSSSEIQKLLPAAVRRAYQDVISERKGKPVVKPGTIVPKVGVTTKTDAKSGPVVWLSASPAVLKKDVDYKRTTSTMYQRGEAYIKGSATLHKWKITNAKAK